METRAETAVALPDWARRPARVESRPARPLAPSAIGEDEVTDPPPGPAMRAAAERGRLLHALFERLPAVPPAERAMRAERWLAAAGGLADAGARAEIVRDALAILDDPRFAALFAADALAEAPIAATLANGLVVSGTVDRLLIGPTHIRVVDFKTGRRVPEGADAIPPYHLDQMAAYVAALATIFPERRIDAALLYTAGPRLFALGAEQLEAHKPRFREREQS